METITRVETFLVAPRWLFVRVETSGGLVGWGEASCEGRSEMVRTAVHQLAEYLIGQDPFRIEDHWQVMSKGSFYRHGVILSSAVAGLDQALWDLLGKSVGLPVHVLLGGPVRDRVRVCCWVGGDEPAEVADQIAEVVEEGMTAVKMNASGRMKPLGTPASLQGVFDRVAAARGVLGADRDVAVDLHGRFTLATARRLARLLEPLSPFFLEEPVAPENSHLIGQVVASTVTPVSTGERLYTRQEFLPVLQSGIAVAQPDLSHAGGISEVRRIASLCEAFDVALAPHCPLGPSPWRPVCRWPSPRRTTSSRSRASGSTTTRTPRCSTTWSTGSRSGSSTATSSGSPARAWGSRSTRRVSGRRTGAGTPGATPCGATTTAGSRNGESGRGLAYAQGDGDRAGIVRGGRRGGGPGPVRRRGRPGRGLSHHAGRRARDRAAGCRGARGMPRRGRDGRHARRGGGRRRGWGRLRGEPGDHGGDQARGGVGPAGGAGRLHAHGGVRGARPGRGGGQAVPGLGGRARVPHSPAPADA